MATLYRISRMSSMVKGVNSYLSRIKLIFFMIFAKLSSSSRIPRVEVPLLGDCLDDHSLSRDELVTKHISLVTAIANKLKADLPPGIDLNDLVGYGQIGLVEAAGRYDSERSVPFEAYAYPRIRGAMLDWLRSLDLVPRSVRKRAKALREARETVVEREGRPATRREVAAVLGVDLKKLEQLERTSRLARMVSFQAPIGSDDGDLTVEDTVPDDAPSILELLLDSEEFNWFLEAVERLPPREQVAVRMYNLEGSSLVEVGRALGVSESRACQLKRSGLERLRFKFARRSQEHLLPSAVKAKPVPSLTRSRTSPQQRDETMPTQEQIQNAVKDLRPVIASKWFQTGEWRSAHAVILEIQHVGGTVKPLLLMNAARVLEGEGEIEIRGQGTPNVEFRLKGADADTASDPPCESPGGGEASGSSDIPVVPPPAAPVPPAPAPSTASRAPKEGGSAVSVSRSSKLVSRPAASSKPSGGSEAVSAPAAKGPSSPTQGAGSEDPLGVKRSPSFMSMLRRLKPFAESCMQFARKDVLGPSATMAEGSAFRRCMLVLVKADLVTASGGVGPTRRYTFKPETLEYLNKYEYFTSSPVKTRPSVPSKPVVTPAVQGAPVDFGDITEIPGISRSPGARKLILNMADLVRSCRPFVRKDALEGAGVGPSVFHSMKVRLLSLGLIQQHGNSGGASYNFVPGAAEVLERLFFIEPLGAEEGVGKTPSEVPTKGSVDTDEKSGDIEAPAPDAEPLTASGEPKEPTVELDAPAVPATEVVTPSRVTPSIANDTQVWRVRLTDGREFITFGTVSQCSKAAERGAKDVQVQSIEFLGLTDGCE